MSVIQLPITRYSGSKRKLVANIWENLERLDLQFDSVMDVFGGSGIFSYFAKVKGKQVIYNDVFRFNYLIGKALVENTSCSISELSIHDLLTRKSGKHYKSIIEKNFSDVYFTDKENAQIDVVVQNIMDITDASIQASAYYLLFQSCIIKRPYNLFHRKNLHMRLNYTGGNFGNKVTWERSFDELFTRFANELNHFTFDNGKDNIAKNSSALNCDGVADLVYIDPPYFVKNNGDNVSYHKKYHFLEGLAHYDEIENSINFTKVNKEVDINNIHEFDQKDCFLKDLEKLVLKHTQSILVISYRNNGVPSIAEIRELLLGYRNDVYCINIGNHGYALNRSNELNFEYLFICF